MKYRPFGTTGMSVSEIGFGCWEMGGSYGSIEEREVIAATNRAIDLGVNCFDTAEGYGMGESERLLAKALGNRRNEVIVVTKFGIQYEHGKDSSRAMVHAAIDRGLKSLDTDYIDVFLVHWPDRKTPFDETMRALDEVVQAGKARAVGLSNFTLDEIKTCMETRRVDVLQYGHNLFDRRMSQWIFPYIKEQSIGLMTYGSLAYGLLAGAFTEETTFEERDWRGRGGGGFSLRLFAPEVFKRNVLVADDLKTIAADYGTTLPQLAIAWALTNGAISTALVGARRVSEVEANVGAVELRLSDDVIAKIDAVFEAREVNTAPKKWVEAVDKF
ncbi:MAG: aldo/keto reductase [Candidatus Poribacteria bacterium]|nr:aldo/keto reductase [Candidatus Poribacteria bacterium]